MMFEGLEQVSKLVVCIIYNFVKHVFTQQAVMFFYMFDA